MLPPWGEIAAVEKDGVESVLGAHLIPFFIAFLHGDVGLGEKLGGIRLRAVIHKYPFFGIEVIDQVPADIVVVEKRSLESVRLKKLRGRIHSRGKSDSRTIF